ncbi:MAG TPA: MBL fold metallo-hydrolase [Patescibacteria group bacterium]|nr:MBL fold metallo-hydrolase [Patescibacteria group bacterium]
MAENCYLVYDQLSKEAVIIDPGEDADYIERVIADLSLTPMKVLVTHGHFDHLGSAYELMLAYKIPLWMSAKDEFLLNKLSPAPVITKDLKRKDKIGIGKASLSVIECPGHTPGGLCFYSAKEKLLFSGDLIFAGGALGRTDFYYSEKDELDKSIAKITRLGNVLIYPGHGDEFKKI